MPFPGVFSVSPPFFFRSRRFSSPAESIVHRDVSQLVMSFCQYHDPMVSDIFWSRIRSGGVSSCCRFCQYAAKKIQAEEVQRWSTYLRGNASRDTIHPRPKKDEIPQCTRSEIIYSSFPERNSKSRIGTPSSTELHENVTTPIKLILFHLVCFFFGKNEK